MNGGSTNELDGPALPPSPSLPARAPDPVQHELVGIPPDDVDLDVVLDRSRVLEEPEPVPLRPTRWVRVLYVLVAVLSLPVQVVAVARGGPFAFVGVVLFVVILLWTWVALDNARRLLAHSRRSMGVSPWRGVFWWIAIAVVGAPLLWALTEVRERHLQRSGRFGPDADVIWAFVVIAYVLLMLGLWLRPYLYLGNVMRRINGNPGVFHRWCYVPIVLAFGVAALAYVLLRLVADRIGVSDGVGDTEDAVAITLVALSSLAPSVTWMVLGYRAFAEMGQTAEARSAGQRSRRTLYLQSLRPARADLDPPRAP